MDVQVEVMNGDIRMRVGKYICPSIYVDVFTPIEFEEIVNLFNKFDGDGSGELDIKEMRALLFESDMDFDEGRALELVKELDQDKSGLIDFEEFCAFLVRVKAWDVKLKGFGTLTDTLNTNYVAILEKQRLKRHLKISCHIVSERPPTVFNPVKTYVMEVRLEGEWIEPSKDGGLKRSTETRRFQGIGKTTREGRMRAAEAALAKLHGLMPGLEVPHGTLPPKWERWLKNNAKQGGITSLQRLLALLCDKGFAPYANAGVMQWASAFASFDRMVGECPGTNPTANDDTELGPGLRAWIDHCLSIGIEGAVLIDVMQDKGVSISNMEAYTQRLRRGDGASCAEVVYPRLLDFWKCCECGLLLEVELYLSAGQPPNETSLYAPRGTVSLPLALAASRGHCEIVDALVSRKADVRATDMMGRTALHHAAKYGDVKACTRLLEHSASVNAKDSFGCTPLHMAARDQEYLAQGRSFEPQKIAAGYRNQHCPLGRLTLLFTMHPWVPRSTLVFKAGRLPHELYVRFRCLKHCRNNNSDCCELLAFHGEETLRNIVNDRIPVAQRSFTEILETSFQHMLKTRLGSNETHRFRKDWVHDAVCWCRDQMYEDKKWLLQEPSRELVKYVVKRFDPDPEAGFWHLKAGQPPTFVPSVTEPWHLSDMIRHMFRLAVCGAKDNRGWTALHHACFENRISSHEKTIRALVNFYQHDFFQVDNNDKLAIDLLFAFDNGRLNTPSGSSLKESLLIDKRKEILEEDREHQDAEDEEEKEKNREEIMRRIHNKAVDMDHKLWAVTREASLHLRTLGGWMEYVDTETLNRFYYQSEAVQRGVDEKTQDELKRLASKQRSTGSASASPTIVPVQDYTRTQAPLSRHATGAKAETGQLQSGGGNGAGIDGDEAETKSIDHFQWDKPQGFAKEEAYILGWASVINRSEFIRTHAGRYNTVLDCKTGVVFYVDTSNEACLLAPPRETTLAWTFEHSVPTTRLLGQSRDWEMRIDQDGNEFFCLEKMEKVERGRVVEEVLTRDLRWERPADAVQPVDLTAGDYALCTMDVAGYERTEQPWYTCLECEAEWKGNMETFRVCVACARNCHKGRLGHRTHFSKISKTRCMCCERQEGGCLYFSKKEEVVQSFLERRCTAVDEKAALDAAEELTRVSPPILAYVPELWPDGTQKDICGWQICRRKSNTPISDGWIVCHDPELPRRIPVGVKVRPRFARDAKVEIRSDEQASARRAEKAGITKGVFFWRGGFVIRAASDDWYTVRIQGRAVDDTSSEESGLAKVEPLEWEFPKDRLSMEGSPVFFFHPERRECTWEPPLETTIGNPSCPENRDGISLTPEADQISGEPEATECDSHTDQILTEGAGKDGKASRRGRATLDGDTEGNEDDKGDLEVISSASSKSSTGNDFNGDRHGGIDVNETLSKAPQMFPCGYPPLYLDEWEGIQKKAKVLFIKGRYMTYLDRETASVFYHDQISAALEKFATMVQRKWRRMKRRQGDQRISPRARTEAFSFKPPEELSEQMKLCTAWAYLRRSARLIRQVRDRDDDVWEEYQDRSTGLRFFYCPDLIKSRFHPPELLPPASEEPSSKARLNVGDRVAFRFRGDAVPSTAEVVKVRKTQDRTDAGDTVHSVHYDVRECEISSPQSYSAGSTSTTPSAGGRRGSGDGGGGQLRTERWLSRRVLSKAPKTADEIAIDKQEAAWRQDLAAAKSRRQKELSRRAEEIYRTERFRKRGAAGMMLARRERGRTVLQATEIRKNRAAAEKALREEERRLAVVKAQKASQKLLSAMTLHAPSKDEGLIKRQRTKLKQLSPKSLAKTSERSPRGFSTSRSVEAGKENSHFPSGMNAECGGTHGHKEIEMQAHEQRPANANHRQESYRKKVEAPQEDRMSVRQEALCKKLREREDAMTTPRTAKRRELIRMVHTAMVRQAGGFVICEWGCRTWVRLGQEAFFHQTEQCCKRIIPCELGCGLRMRQEEWLGPSRVNPKASCQQQHEEVECPRRLVPCKQRCGEWLPFDELMHHMKVSCAKRPFPPIKCRLGCGETFEGGLHRMLQSEEERIGHEHDVCPHRLLHCAWTGCEEMVMARDHKKHREEHVTRSGVFLFPVPGKYAFKVPSGCRNLKVQAWGAGGGSGHLKGGQSGDGGGGAFVEALIHVTPNEELEITVGGCGSAGVYGSEVMVPGGEDLFGKPVLDIVDQHGEAGGGWPRGGAGHGGNPQWAAGGGGGYSMVAKKVGRYGEGGTEPLVVAGGGGGGGSRAGVPGGGLNGEIPGTKVDIRNGRMGTATAGGAAGDSGDINGCTFPPKHGQSWQGGDGGQYGGGGGSGWFGGGGGGTSPGIVGGGGGGSSFINSAVVIDFIVLQGIGCQAGGMDRKPPRARGLDEWDMVGGTCGEGGKAGPWELNPGKNGAVRLHKSGFFEKQLDHN